MFKHLKFTLLSAVAGLLGLVASVGATNWPVTVSTDSTLLTAVNNCGTILNTSVTNLTSVLQVVNTGCFPSAGYVTLESEAISYTGKTSTSFTGCTRGADGTTAVTHAAGKAANQYMLAAYHNVLKNELIGMSTYFLQGAQLHITTSTTKIGIGTSTPSYELHVATVAGMSNAIFAVSTGAVDVFKVSGGSVNVQVPLYFSDGSSQNKAGLAKSGDTMTGTLLMQSSIGISTGIPQALVHIATATGSTGNLLIVSTGPVSVFSVLGASVNLQVPLYFPDGSQQVTAFTGGTVVSYATITVTTALIVSTQSSVVVDSGNGHGATNTKIRRFTNSKSTGTAITYADDSNNGATFTINKDGFYVISYTDRANSSNFNIGISVNSTALTTVISSITPAAGKLTMTSGTAALFANCTAAAYLRAGDIVRAHTDGVPDSNIDNVIFRIQRMQ